MDTPSEMPTSNARMPVAKQLTAEESIPLTRSEQALQKRTDALDTAFVESAGRDGVGGDVTKVTARTELCRRIARLVDAKRNVRDRYGEVVDTEDDVAAQLKAVELGLKLIGDLVEVKTEVNVDASSKTLVVSASEREELDRLRAVVHNHAVEVKNG